MANTKISDLAAVVTLGLTDSFPVVQSSTTKKAVVSDILDPTYSGNLKFAGGYGIDFSASEGGGASSSVLDDYEEGTWTPNNNSDATGVLGAATTGRYTKIGRIVHLFVFLNVATDFTAPRISGLPFVVAGTSETSARSVARCALLAVDDVCVYAVRATTTLNFFNDGDAADGHPPVVTNFLYRTWITYETT